MQDNHCHLNLSSFNCMIIYTCADAFYHHSEGILKRETNKYTSSNNYISRSGGLRVINLFNSFAPGDFAEKRVLKLVEWFSGHCRAIKS